VLREANCQTDAASNRAKQMVLIYDRKNASRDADPSPQYVAIDPDDYVPLIIDGAAKIGSDSDGKSMLSVTLARENVAKLEAFTRSHLGGKVANVIGGQIVTLHKVRAVIPDGQLQITRCEDDACRMIWSELSPWPTITDIDGHRHQPFEQPDVKAVVMVFVLADCPIANSYVPKLNRMNDEFVKQGVRFFLVESDLNATVEHVRAHAQSYEIAAPVLLDSEHVWVKLAGVTKTPEAAVFVPDGRMPYRGRIDDQYAALGKRRAEATSFDLEEAIKAVLAGRSVEHPLTDAIGCFIPE
jgi:hypothetical protein